MSAPNLKFQVSGNGWAVSQPISQIIPAGTLIDTSQVAWAALANVAPPIDAVALDQSTADYMVGFGTTQGLNYDPNRVRVGPGVVSRALDQATSDYWEKPNHKGSPSVR